MIGKYEISIPISKTMFVVLFVLCCMIWIKTGVILSLIPLKIDRINQN